MYSRQLFKEVFMNNKILSLLFIGFFCFGTSIQTTAKKRDISKQGDIPQKLLTHDAHTKIKTYNLQLMALSLGKLETLANKGNVKAQLNLGAIYYEGRRGVKKNPQEAFKWIEKAAKKGNAQAQDYLGVLYSRGDGVKQSYPDALIWHSLAAKQGYANAQFNLGITYHQGKGIKQNYKEALKWYKLAAEQNHTQAQTNLGGMYNTGQGVRKNNQEAFEWVQKAAKQNNARAQVNLGLMYARGEGVEQSYPEAFRLLDLPAKHKNTIALRVLKRINRNFPLPTATIKDVRVSKDYSLSIENNAYTLGMKYYRGDGMKQVKKNYASKYEAFKLFTKAAKKDHAQAQFSLGYMYEIGSGVKKSYKEAFKWYKKAAKQGDANAQYNLGIMYYRGKGVKKNYEEAFKLFDLAANQRQYKALRAFQKLKKHLHVNIY